MIQAGETQSSWNPSHPLEWVFAPRNVAVIGASERKGSIGRVLLENLLDKAFKGKVFPVNPKHTELLGHETYASVGDVPVRVDLAVIATPAAQVPDIVGQCVTAGVRGAIIISAGFKETGESGEALEQAILAHAKPAKMCIIGPNCLGLIRPSAGLNASFAGVSPAPGRIAFLSQSGALGTAILDWAAQKNVGFSAFVSVGSMLDVGWGDLIDYFADDPHTKSILIYMESIGDARSFLSAAREAALSKPIIVIKPGRSAEGARAAASHTGSLVGRDEVLDAAFRRVGVLRVDSIESLFDMATVLAKQPRPRGPRLTIVTNAGGPGVLATDALIRTGGCLTELSPATLGALDQILPAAWSHGNPVDVLGDADPERFVSALTAASKDENGDGLLVVLTPQAMTDPTNTARRVTDIARGVTKPLFACWMGGVAVADGVDILSVSGVPTFAYPDRAAAAFADLWRYAHQLEQIYETPQLAGNSDPYAPDSKRVEHILMQARRSGRTLLTEAESKEVLAAYHLPVLPHRVAKTEAQAVHEATNLGYPVVVKVSSTVISHKRRMGGVKLNLANADAVRDAFRAVHRAVDVHLGAGRFEGVTVQPMVQDDGFEVVIGSSSDPQFGPVLLFGAGGSLVEVMADYRIALPPLNSTLARRMMEGTRIFRALLGNAPMGTSPDVSAVEDVLVRFSQLVIEQPGIREIDINPVLVSGGRCTALDARIVLHDQGTTPGDLPRPAIRPYPSQYCGDWTMKDGTTVLIRPIRPEDERLMIDFHKSLSPETVRFRYFNMFKLDQRTAHERLARICFVDYDRIIALVAVTGGKGAAPARLLGVTRMTKLRATDDAEWAVVISDDVQRRGLGGELLRRLIRIARGENVHRLIADILPDNIAMQRLASSLGMQLEYDAEERVMHAHMRLTV